MASEWLKPFTKPEMDAIRRALGEPEKVTADFWQMFRGIGRRLPFAEDALAAFFCATDPATPARVKMLLLGAVAYIVMPIDGVADFLPFVGFADDAAFLATAIAAVRGHMSERHWQRARVLLGRDDAGSA